MHHMYPYEHHMVVMKGYVRNHAHPEGFMIEGYMTEEVIECCVDYIKDGKPIGVLVSRHHGILSGSYTLGTAGHRSWPNKSRYGPVLSNKKRLGNQIPHTGHGPTTPSWRGGITNLKKLDTWAIRTNPFSHLIGRGKSTFHHLSTQSSLPSCPGTART
jgi:hypothetical protein